jgi:hypothetical protein
MGQTAARPTAAVGDAVVTLLAEDGGIRARGPVEVQGLGRVPKKYKTCHLLQESRWSPLDI